MAPYLVICGFHCNFVFYWNKCELLAPGVMESRFLMALTGQIGLSPREGIFNILTAFLACMVLDHFINSRSPGEANITSPRAD